MQGFCRAPAAQPPANGSFGLAFVAAPCPVAISIFSDVGASYTLVAYSRSRMLQDGVASAEDIDRAMVLGYRHPIGPLALTDLVGLDVRLAITEHLHRELGTDTFKAPKVLRRMVRAGKLGKKSGQGFYTY
jgi:3-hydroxyacyl-CoA dehydrogenase